MSDEGLRKAMLELMVVLSKDIVTTEATADGLVQAAAELFVHSGAETLREAALGKRVNALELRGKLAALREKYAALFPPKL